MLMSFVNLISLPTMTTPLSSCHIIKRVIIHARLKCKSIKKSCCHVSAIQKSKKVQTLYSLSRIQADSEVIFSVRKSEKIQKSYSLSRNPRRSRSHIRSLEIQEDPEVILIQNPRRSSSYFANQKSKKIQRSYSLSRNPRRSRSHIHCPEIRENPEVIFVGQNSRRSRSYIRYPEIQEDPEDIFAIQKSQMIQKSQIRED